MAVEVGARAPDFTLPSAAGGEVTLSSFRGRRSVVLVFFPNAFSPVCTRQLTGIGANEARYAEAGAQVIGISCDQAPSLAAFAGELGLTDTILLSDFEPKGEVARRYGVYIGPPWGLAGRATFVVDREGIVRAAAMTETPLEIPPEDQTLRAVAVCALG